MTDKVPEGVREAFRMALAEAEYFDHDTLITGAFEIVFRLPAPDRIALARVLDPGWMPIETAPKDQEPILAHWINSGTTEIVCRSDTPCDGFEWATDDGAYVSTPTHWQPLPAPPTTDADTEGERK